MADDLLPLVYTELRRLAAGQLRGEAPGQTLQPTAVADGYQHIPHLLADGPGRLLLLWDLADMPTPAGKGSAP